MKTAPRIVFFGTDEFSAPTLESLLRDKRAKVVAVVTKPDAISGRGKRLKPSRVANIVAKHNENSPKNEQILLYKPEKLREIAAELRELSPDLGVLVSFGKLVPEATIAIFPHGIVNIHPSLLPKLRGPSPIETAILDGNAETGVTLMKLVREMDAGPIVAQQKIALSGREDSVDLRANLAKIGAELLRENLTNIANGTAAETPQDDARATFSHLIAKSDAILDPNELTADECDRRIRAFLAWPRARINLAASSARFTANFPAGEIIITSAHPLEISPGDAWPDVIVCRNDTALKIDRLVSPKSGKEIAMKDFLRGLK